MNTISLTDEELGYLYNLSSRVIAKHGVMHLMDEQVFQKLWAAATAAGLNKAVDMSEYIFNGNGFYRVDGGQR